MSTGSSEFSTEFHGGLGSTYHITRHVVAWIIPYFWAISRVVNQRLSFCSIIRTGSASVGVQYSATLQLLFPQIQPPPLPLLLLLLLTALLLLLLLVICYCYIYYYYYFYCCYCCWYYCSYYSYSYWCLLYLNTWYAILVVQGYFPWG